MNVENIKRVREAIAAAPAEKFSMARWGDGTLKDLHRCGTAACIGGWAEAVLIGEARHESYTIAALGLTADQSAALFYPVNYSSGEHTQAAGLRVLDLLIETGEVRWEQALAEASR